MASKTREDSRLPPPWDRIFSLGTRTFVWGMFLAVLYILRPFFLTVFLTFLFAYIQAHGVHRLAGRIPNRPARVVVVFMVLLSTLGGLGYFLAPRIGEQAEIFAEELPRYLQQADVKLQEFIDQNPSLRRFFTDQGEGPESTSVQNEIDPGTPTPLETEEPQAAGQDDPVSARDPPTLLQDMAIELLGFGAEGEPDSEGQQSAVLARTIENVASVGAKVLSIGSAFFLSLLFSFLIVMDLPKLQRSVNGLSGTKIGFIYDEVADNIRDFGKVLGRAMEAQLVIALCNTAMTAVGISILGLPNVVFLSAIVFFCSFIPVAGVFISSLPICLIAIQQEDGFSLMLIAIGLILIIHTIEAYFLNPQIFGHHLRMNPVLVLIVLILAGKLFGVWGLILGVPIVNYVFAHAIRRKPPEPQIAAA